MFRAVTSSVESPHGEVRFRAALHFLTQQEKNRPLLVVAHSLDAARDLMRAATRELGATFGWSLESLSSLAVKLAALPLAERRLTVATPLALEAVCVRVVAELHAAGQLGRFEAVADRPGLPRALQRTFADLALADVNAASLAAECPELAAAFERYQGTLAELQLADRAEVYRTAIAAVRQREAICLYDLAPPTKLEKELARVLEGAASRVFVSHASSEGSDIEEGASALQRLQAQLFTSREQPGASDDTVSILSAPGESRECVEIARRILQEASRGLPFDRMAILLRSPFHYRTHLVEALRRAQIPAQFSRGAVRPEPGGRALIVLLRCAAEGLSALRFAEYLSLGQEPQSAETQFPRRWESLLVNAAVVGGAERWRRRLAGLEQELSRKASEPDEADYAERDLLAIRALSGFALPLIEQLAALPTNAKWGDWLVALRELAERAIAKPEVVLEVLAELEIVSHVGPVSLSEVRSVLEERLGELQLPPTAAVGAQVLVASVEEGRGRVFDSVFVPGLAEKLFPQRVVEDPLLSDQSRARISDALETQPGRVHREREALRIAVGCARRRLFLSYPRFESDKARPRVPSFYALEAIRAAEGTLPGFAALQRRADAESRTRMGWPAPDRPEAAIDASEYDLSTLRVLLSGTGAEREGAARYLVTEHKTLGRALQTRARRWLKSWHSVDGFVDPSAAGKKMLEERYQALKARGFSVTALEKYAACPYRFFLATVVGLRQRDTIEHVEELDPATRGILFHEVVQELATRLKQDGLLSANADARAAEALTDRVIGSVSEAWRDKLAPAIERVWQDAIEDLRLDVRYWLRDLLQSDWQPVEAELSFGERSVPVVLESGLALRGRIDAVEQRHGELRATDYKTGEAPAPDNSVIIKNGTQLQPALYALVLEKLYPNSRVAGGNNFYCTVRGDLQRRHVDLSDLSRKAAAEVHTSIARAFADGFFPAAPTESACETCQFRVSCGPYERERVARKQPDRLEPLEALRGIR